MGEVNAFQDNKSASADLHERAKAVLPGGNTRTTVHLDPYPPYVRSGRGQYIVDVEGQQRLDFLNNYTSLIHGHADPDVVAAVRDQLDLGSSFGLPTPTEIELAEVIVERIPSIEQVRFTNSGTEAVMMAIHAARAYTNRPTIVRFEGAYHGSYDFAASGRAVRRDSASKAAIRSAVGTPDAVLQHALVLPFNDLEVAEQTLEKHHDSIAAVVLDLMPWRMGLIEARHSFVQGLRDITRRLGIVLVFDEVITLRIAYTGAQGVFGVMPDLTTMGKVIGGGFPVGAVGGKSDIMAVFDPRGGKPRVPHGGTFTANPISMLAGLTTLRKLDRVALERLNVQGDYLRQKGTVALRRAGRNGRVIGQGSLFSISLTDEIGYDFPSWAGSESTRAERTRIYTTLLHSGFLVAPHLAGCLSTVMSTEDLDTFVEGLGEAAGR